MSAAERVRRARKAEAEMLRMLEAIRDREQTDYGRLIGGAWATEIATAAGIGQRAAGSKLRSLFNRGLIGRKADVEARAFVYYLRANGHQLLRDHERFDRDAAAAARDASGGREA